MTRIRVVATAGQAPAVLTELGWWSATNAYRVSDLLVWTTGDCLAGVRGHLDAWWEPLRDEVGRDALPRVGEVRVEVLRDAAGKDLPDVRNAADAEVVARQIHADVQRLTDAPGPLVGWFAGGRKTMSSALQSAMTLYGRPGDRLWHALVHEKIEALPREELSTFVWPSRRWAERVGPDVAIRDLVDVAEVPFAAVTRFLVPSAAHAGWTELWEVVAELERVGAEVRAELHLAWTRWRSRDIAWLRFVEGGEVRHELSLDRAPAEFYARVVRGGARGLGEKSSDYEQQLAKRVRNAFGALERSVLAPFCVQTVRGEGYRVPAHDRITILEGESVSG